jgi:hypothetical protein
VGAAVVGLLAELAGPRVAFACFGAAVAGTVVPFLRVVTARALAR